MPFEPKRIILMYISEFSGHHSATLAIEEAIKKISPDTEILNIDTFHYTNPISERITNRLYMGLIQRTPRVWDYLYDNPEVAKRIEKIKKRIHQFNLPKLKRLFDKFQPDAIACTQAFPCGMVADFKKEYHSSIPLVAVLTDYVPHSYWIYDTVDCYISPSDEVTQRLIKKGVSQDKVKSFGIPFDPKFNETVDKDNVMFKLNLNPKMQTILIMGGGQGLGPIKTIIQRLEKIKPEIQEIVVSGSNRKLYKSLKRKKYKKKVVVLGYVDNINELMGISEIIITKPGGVTTAEALAKKIPMVIVKPLPGQEASNTAYLVEKGAAIKINDLKDINSAIEDLLLHPDKLRHIGESAARLSEPNASIDIAKLLLGNS